jgi:hypothetical protein
MKYESWEYNKKIQREVNKVLDSARSSNNIRSKIANKNAPILFDTKKAVGYEKKKSRRSIIFIWKLLFTTFLKLVYISI